MPLATSVHLATHLNLQFTILPYDPKILADEALDYLLDVVRSKPSGRQAQHGVSAAGRILEHVRQSVDPTEFIIELMGDEAAVLDWMREVMPKLEMRVALKQAAQAYKELPGHGGSSGAK